MRFYPTIGNRQKFSASQVQPDAAAIQQTKHGTKPPAELVTSFEGLGESFVGPHGAVNNRNPSDNSLAVGPNYIVATDNVFRGFDGACGGLNNGDAVVRYDQLAGRWLVVMPIFRRLAPRENEPEARR